MRGFYNNDVETTYLSCPQCETSHALTVKIQRGFADHSDFICQACGHPLGTHRADLLISFDMVELGGKVKRAS